MYFKDSVNKPVKKQSPRFFLKVEELHPPLVPPWGKGLTICITLLEGQTLLFLKYSFWGNYFFCFMYMDTC